MKIILHIGAHRTGGATFRSWARSQDRVLARAGVAFWGPEQRQMGLFAGMTPRRTGRRSLQAGLDRAAGRVKLHLDALAGDGIAAVLLSDPDLLGPRQECWRAGRLYPAAGERVARIAAVLGSRLERIVLCPRSPDRFWGSLAAWAVAQGHALPEAPCLERIASDPRGWRDVIADIACAAPDADLCVLPFEAGAADPPAMMRAAIAQELNFVGGCDWLNRAPDLRKLRAALAEQGRDPAALPDSGGPWRPFDDGQAAQMRERYADDLLWLEEGAEGWARLARDDRRDRGQAPRAPIARGQGDDIEGRLDAAG